MQTTGNLIVALTKPTPPLAEQAARARALGADLVELRADQIGDVAAAEAYLRLPVGERPLPCILTVRAREEGGHWESDDADRISLIQYLGMLRPDFIDVELATWERSANVRQKIGLVAGRADGGGEGEREKARLILSYHDLNGTPDDAALAEKLAALVAAPGHVAKAVFTCRDATDAIRILAAGRACGAAKPVMALGIGEGGLLTRVLARKFGFFGAYAALESGAESAPGQPTVEQMADLYRWRSINPTTMLYGVIGWPVSHSLSPKLHNAAMAADSIDGVYVPLPVQPGYEEFAAFMAAARRAEWLDMRGFSVTIPHKEHALRVVPADMGGSAHWTTRTGAANTLVCNGEWKALNTDMMGALSALASARMVQAQKGLHGAVVHVLGCGGVARAVVCGLWISGARVLLYGRERGKVAAVAAEFECEARDWSKRGVHPGEILVNCTPIGMYPNIDDTPVPADRLASKAVVFDTVYNPRETRLLRDARERECETVDGMQMFIEQAKLQYQRWHGRQMPDISI